MQNKTVVSMLVASWSVDDLVSVLSVTIFMFLQWPKEVPGYFQSLCTTSALLYLFQGLSSNLKATLLVSYNFYTMHTAVGRQAASKSSGQVLGAALTVWAASLGLSALPLCGWGAFVRSASGQPGALRAPALRLGRLRAHALGLSGRLLQLLRAAPLRRVRFGLRTPRWPLGPAHSTVAVLRGAAKTPRLLPGGFPQSLHSRGRGPWVWTRASGRRRDPSLQAWTPGISARPQGLHQKHSAEALRLDPGADKSHSLAALDGKSAVAPNARVCRGFGPEPPAAAGTRACRPGHPGSLHGPRGFTRSTAQKRFALILALTKVILWQPLMIHMVVKHVAGVQCLPFETLGFLLTLLASTVTPVFVLSKRWTHLPCGCIINCRQDAYPVASGGKKTNRKGFEFNLSFQQSYGIYKIAHEDYYDDDENSISYHNLMNYECETTKDSQKDNCDIFNAIKVEISTIPTVDSSTLKGINKCTNTDVTEAKEDSDKEKCAFSDKARSSTTYEETTFYEGPERRLSHEENQKPDLSDWEWCRSKSERTSRQRSSGGLAIPLCAFQGTVSLHAPTGKTLSLSTYEVSAEGQKITPASKKIEVYRSKSVGHEPNPEDSPSTIADTSVKIHLEVLEICDNEEALDTVSIISNISQSSTQVRSPSLRYSRKENRFVSCDLGETASYSLFLPTSNPDGDINISIPDTVEAHRQNSKRQHQERDGYQEEIQLLNKAYRKQEEEESKGN
ncbi:Putative G-protein coupled receptor 149 [Fukomys damarensis]|uniref:Putative G-protein coupled receptor 149 n=1 Tax=Fukomys damarensis TaxID=885580 RepID=A0A091DCA9_FUKDA|nr:Putative G-protein coupled receptor 149 [Fukomys damarensis]